MTGAGIVAGACGSGAGDGHPDEGMARDMAAPIVDMADPACPVNGLLHAGPSTRFVAGTPTYFACSHVFVLRDAGGLYAMSAVCTHEGCDVQFKTATHDFECPCHLSVFDVNGAVTMLPAILPLPHFALSIDAGGNVVVDLATQVPAATRLAVQD